VIPNALTDINAYLHNCKLICKVTFYKYVVLLSCMYRRKPTIRWFSWYVNDGDFLVTSVQVTYQLLNHNSNVTICSSHTVWTVQLTIDFTITVMCFALLSMLLYSFQYWKYALYNGMSDTMNNSKAFGINGQQMLTFKGSILKAK